MRVFLHIGSHKTGTTAIQEFASDNANWLREQGLLYPSFDLIGGERERSHLGMINILTSNDSVAETADPGMLLQAARRKAEDDGCNLLFSAESLFRLAKTQQDIVSGAFAKAFADIPITVVCSLRSRAEFAESLYRNGYRAFAKVPEAFPEWLDMARTNFEYERILLAYVQNLGAESLLLSYSKSTRDDFVSFFFRRLGVEIEASGKVPRQKNPSLDVIDCLAKDLVMAGSYDERLSRAFNNFIFKYRISSDYAFLDRDRETIFARKFVEENARMIALEPMLEEVLGTEATAMGKSPIDAACHAAAEARCHSFWVNRSKAAQKRPRRMQ